MNVFLTTLGCRLNEAEIAGYARRFSAAGHSVVTSPEAAQVMVVNTCAVTAEAARKSRKLVSGLHRKNPSAPLVVTGCFSELEPERAAALAGVDLIVRNRDKDRLVREVLDRAGAAAMPALATEADAAGSHVYREARTRAFVKVQDGCRNRCTFCIVTIARGAEHSRAIADVVAEVADLHARGANEVVLTGVHLGGYGSDLGPGCGTDLAALVRAVLAGTDIPRLRLSSLEPWDLPDDFERLWDDPRLMPHVHLPLQSGSDTVLRRMARRCRVGGYRDLVGRLRAAIPDLTVTTDIIVGFPGETDAEFCETLATAEEIGFGHIHIFSYSRRQGTTAARMPDPVPAELARARGRALAAAAARMKAAHLTRALGSARQVLWEGSGELLPGGARRFGGYTDNYLRVETILPAGAAPPSLENRITVARLVATAGDPPDRAVAEIA